MAKAKAKEVAVEEVEVVANETTWQGHPSRDLKQEGMVWNPVLGMYAYPAVEEVIDEAPVDEAPAE